MIINELMLTHSRGLPAEAALYLANLLPIPDLTCQDMQEQCLRDLKSHGYLTGVVQWADLNYLDLIKQHLERLDIRLLWRNRPNYPEKLTERLGKEAPAWVWMAGESQRLTKPICSIVGSRETAPAYLAAARDLARALSDLGVVITSGGARGADTAAHEGARLGQAGMIVIPAHGILTMNMDDCRPGCNHMTALGLDNTQAPFHAGRAIRRNNIIAALGDALVLVASDIKGGSAYAVRWALAHRLPVWCLTDDDNTPLGNQMLIRQGLAEPLPINQPAGILAQNVVESMRAEHKKQASPVKTMPAQTNLFCNQDS